MRYIFFVGFVFFLNVACFADSDERVKVPVGPDGVQYVEITGGGYFFKPRNIVVRVNVPVVFSLKKESTVTPHDFVMKAPEAGIDVSIDLSTEPKIISFTPAKTGTYAFFCDRRFLFFKSHRGRGMEGSLEVID